MKNEILLFPENPSRFISNCVRMRFEHTNKTGSLFLFLFALHDYSEFHTLLQTNIPHDKIMNTNMDAKRMPAHQWYQVNINFIPYRYNFFLFRKRYKFHTDASISSFMFPNQQLTSQHAEGLDFLASKIFSIAFIVNGARDMLDIRVKYDNSNRTVRLFVQYLLPILSLHFLNSGTYKTRSRKES